jgi:hypothetical protein
MHGVWIWRKVKNVKGKMMASGQESTSQINIARFLCCDGCGVVLFNGRQKRKERWESD